MPKFLRLVVLFGAVLALSVPAFSVEWPAFVLYQKDGTRPNGYFGTSVANAGDVDGDGKSDFIIGEQTGGGTQTGKAYVYSGATGALLYEKSGAANSDLFGYSVAGAGDVNLDGRADFVVGAPGVNSNAGNAYVYSGATGNLFYSFGALPGSSFGWSVAGAGDVDGDGKADIIIGAPFADVGFTDNGLATVYQGFSGVGIYSKTGTAGEQFGYSVSGAGDVNGDGRADFIVGAPSASPGGLSAAGSAYIYSGITGALLFQKDGAAANDELGHSVAGAGDVNGDGKADIITGAWRADPGGLTVAGSAFVYSGATNALLFQKDGAAVSSYLGGSVAGAGDVNGDGRADFIIGATGTSSFTGSAYLYSGLDGSLLFQKNGNAVNDLLGSSVAGAGDVNADGRADFIIGAAGAFASGFSSAGLALLFQSGYGEDIQSVADVGSDQGKQVRLKWKSLPGDNGLVTNFALFRRQDAALARTNPPPVAAWANSLPPGNWDFVGSVPAFGDTLYQTLLPTLADSTGGGPGYSAFFVRAATDDPLTFFDSPIDSGYSVDNLAPSPPLILAAVGTCQGMVNLNYSTPVDEDFQYFKVYRDTSGSFSNAVVAGTTIDSFFADAAPLGQTLYYRVTAVDFSGNEGSPSPQADALAGAKGDMNNSGNLSPADVVLELNAVFLDSPFPAPFCAADLNCSGNLSPADVVLELNLVFLDTPVTCTP